MTGQTTGASTTTTTTTTTFLPRFRPAVVGAAEHEEARSDRAVRVMVGIMLLLIVVIFYYSVNAPEPDIISIPPLLGRNGTRIGLAPPPYGAVLDGSVTTRLLARAPSPDCTRADAEPKCWPFNDSQLLGLLDLADNPLALFHVARYARATFPGLWAAGAIATADRLFFGVDARDVSIVSIVLILVHILVWAASDHALLKKRRLPRPRESPQFLYSRLAWPRMAAQTMLSYAWGEASDLAIALAHILPHTWLDRYQLQVSDDIAAQTTSACVHARLVVILLTPGYLTSKNCCAELRAAALHRGHEHRTVVLMPPFTPRVGETQAAATSRRLGIRRLVATLPGFVVFDSVADLLGYVHQHVLESSDASERLRTLRWWQTYGAPVRLVLEDDEDGGGGGAGGGGGGGGGGGASGGGGGDGMQNSQPVPSPAMRRQHWPLSDLFWRLPTILAVFFRLRNPASHGKLYAGFAYLSDDALTLGLDHRPHPWAFVPLLGFVPTVANFVIAGAAVAGIVVEHLTGLRLLLAGVLALCNVATGVHSASYLLPYVRVSANVLASRSLLFLCFAACLEDRLADGGSGGSGSGSGGGAGAPASPAVVVHPSGAAVGSSSSTSSSSSSSSVVTVSPVALPPPDGPANPQSLGLAAQRDSALADKRLRIVFVHEAPAPANTPAALAQRADLAELHALPVSNAEKDDAQCLLFEPQTLSRVLANLREFVGTHLGLQCSVETLDDVLGPESDGGEGGASTSTRAAERMCIYVFFLGTTAGAQRWVRAASGAASAPRGGPSEADSGGAAALASSSSLPWPAQQTVVVVPPYAVVACRAPELLSSLVLFAGDKCFAARSSRHAGIAPAVMGAVAAKVSAVLLERLE
jgi:uncharacterized membrane protein YgcG